MAMWARLIHLCLGVWLMAAPAVLGYAGAARTNDRIAGPIAAALAAVAVSEVTRPLRRANVPVGAWLLIAPWVLHYDGGGSYSSGGAATANSLIVGTLLIALSLVRGTVKGRYGGGWRVV